jgi:hypothetical protein
MVQYNLNDEIKFFYFANYYSYKILSRIQKISQIIKDKNLFYDSFFQFLCFLIKKNYLSEIKGQ